MAKSVTKIIVKCKTLDIFQYQLTGSLHTYYLWITVMYILPSGPVRRFVNFVLIRRQTGKERATVMLIPARELDRRQVLLW